MAKAIRHAPTMKGSSLLTPSRNTLIALRLVLGIGVIIGSAISLVGTSWDIQWHSFVGRDRTLIPPHIMMLTGIAIGGLLSLAAVLVETGWVRRNPQLSQYSTNFADLFYGSLGTYVTGFAALNAAIAFPLDSYWHALYGIDVAIWAPFHVMILVGMAIMPLGAAYTFNTTARLAAASGNRRFERSGYVFTIIAIGIMMSIFTIVLSDALNKQNYIVLGPVLVTVYPFIAGLLVAYSFVTAQQSTPFRWAASGVIAAFVLVAVIFSLFVPPATNFLVIAEHLTYRRNLHAYSYLSVLAVRLWPLLPIVVAPLADFINNLARKQPWSRARTTVTLALCIVPACLPLAVFSPNAILSVLRFAGPVGFLLSLALGFVGTYLGTWLGQRTGETMRRGEGSTQ